MVKSLGAGIQKAVEKYYAENNLSDRLEGYKWEFNLVEDPSRPMLESAPLMRRSSLLPVGIWESLQAGLSVCVGVECACCAVVIPPVRPVAESPTYLVDCGLLVERIDWNPRDIRAADAGRV